MWQFEQPGLLGEFFPGRIACNRLSALRRANAARPGARQGALGPEISCTGAQSPFLGVRDDQSGKAVPCGTSNVTSTALSALRLGPGDKLL